MSDSWQSTRLEELGRIVTGKTPSTAEPLYWGGNIPFVTPSDMDGQRIIERTDRSLSGPGAKNVEKSIIPAGAVMVSCIGSDMGKAAIAAHECVTNQQINSIIVASKSDARFVYYNLSMRKEEIRASAGGSAQPILNKTDFGSLDIELPPLDEQRTIARVLGVLDDKIELNMRMNRSLDELAATLFRSWIVDFDPVVTKAAGRAPLVLTPKVAALFPSTFVNSELGPVPQGWRTGKIAELASMSRGGINPADFPSEVFDHYSLPAFDEGQRPQAAAGDLIKSNKFPVPETAVLVSKLNPHTPRVWMPELTGERRAICSTEFLVMTPKSPSTREFLRCLFSSDGFTSEFATFVTGTSGSHQRVKPDSLLGMDAIIPSAAVLEQFTKTVRPWFKQIAHNIRESHALAVLRDALLPKLLSGELRVKDAESKATILV